MNTRLSLYIDLLHRRRTAALATIAKSMPGYPYASHVRYAPDDRHRPLLLLSQLAEHTRNLMADDRASLLLEGQDQGFDTPRITLVGHLRPAGNDERLMRRFLRYQPEAAALTHLGDFALYFCEIRRARPVGGFAQAGWLEGAQINDLPHLGLAEEETLLAKLSPRLAASLELLGLDAFGADLRYHGQPLRLSFTPAPILPPALIAAFERALSDNPELAAH